MFSGNLFIIIIKITITTIMIIIAIIIIIIGWVYGNMGIYDKSDTFEQKKMKVS